MTERGSERTGSKESDNRGASDSKGDSLKGQRDDQCRWHEGNGSES